MKKDGHTHTEFCPHGSEEDVELYIIEAIKQNFTEYSITEHAPISNDFLKKAAGVQFAIDTAGMRMDDVEAYLSKMDHLKKKYASEIKINVGFELDYLPDHQQWTIDFLSEYGKYMDDSILSVHFLPGNGGYRAIDYSGSDYDQGIVQYYGSFQKAQEVYLQTIIDSVNVDLGPYKPKRIGHITLCQKFQQCFDEPTELSKESHAIIDQLLQKMKVGQYELDFNSAGLYKEFCGETYPPLNILSKAQMQGVSIVFGSDAHKSSDVGRSYTELMPVECLSEKG